MKREESKEIIRKAHFNIDNPNKEGELAVDKIYDYFESKNCKNCKHHLCVEKSYKICDQLEITTGDSFYCNLWEQKNG